MTIRPLGSGRASDPEIHLLTGARALGAIDVAEAQSFDDHLADCPTCAEEYSSLVATAAMLGAAEAASPPRSLRRRVLQDVSHTRQLPPPVTALDSRRPAWRRPVTWLAAAAAAAVIATGVTWSLSGSDDPRSIATLQECVASATDVVSTAPSVGTGGEIRTSRICNAVVVQLPEMGTVPAGSDFQIWRVDATGKHSLGLAKHGADGSVPASMVSFSLSDTDKAVAVTTEPAGGSKQPQGDIFWQADL